MTTLTHELHAQASEVTVTKGDIIVQLMDGRTIIVPVQWYPRLFHATGKERKNWKLIGKGEGIHWSDLDEDISVQNLLLGQPSGESLQSFKRWLETRKGKKQEK